MHSGQSEFSENVLVSLVSGVCFNNINYIAMVDSSLHAVWLMIL